MQCNVKHNQEEKLIKQEFFITVLCKKFFEEFMLEKFCFFLSFVLAQSSGMKIRLGIQMEIKKVCSIDFFFANALIILCISIRIK